MDSPLLSYVDVRHANFLSPFLTVGEAWDLGPRYITAEDLSPVKDESVERVSQSHKVDVLVEELEAPARPAEASQDAKMVTRRKMTIDRFLPGTRPTAQP